MIACVRTNGKLTEWFVIETGVRQGCIMLPWLFKMFIDVVMCPRKVKVRILERSMEIAAVYVGWWTS